jgi:hypothetical protein
VQLRGVHKKHFQTGRIVRTCYHVWLIEKDPEMKDVDKVKSFRTLAKARRFAEAATRLA